MRRICRMKICQLVHYLIFIFRLKKVWKFLAVGGVLCEPLSKPNSLLTAKNTGNSRKFASQLWLVGPQYH